MKKLKKSKRGGKREGSGRKKKEPTKVIRVPLNKPDFQQIAFEETGDTYNAVDAFVDGCNYVWKRFIDSKL